MEIVNVIVDGYEEELLRIKICNTDCLVSEEAIREAIEGKLSTDTSTKLAVEALIKKCSK